MLSNNTFIKVIPAEKPAADGFKIDFFATALRR